VRKFAASVVDQGPRSQTDRPFSPPRQSEFRHLPRRATRTAPGWDGIRRILTQFRTAFPDLHIVIEEQVVEDYLVASRTTTRGTHRGPLFGIEATGKTVIVPGLTMVRVVDGHVVESWVKNDIASLMAQLGVASLKR
jgi:predicted ester cyclase